MPLTDQQEVAVLELPVSKAQVFQDVFNGILGAHVLAHHDEVSTSTFSSARAHFLQAARTSLGEDVVDAIRETSHPVRAIARSSATRVRLIHPTRGTIHGKHG